MTHKLRAGLAAAIMLWGAASAPAQSPGAVIDRIDAAGLRALVSALGDEITNEMVTDDGQPVITASSGDLNYLVAGTVCENGQCQGLLTELIFTNSSATLEVANDLNQNYAAIKVVILEDGSVVFSRYDVVDGGTTLGALSASVDTLLAIVGAVIEGSQE